MHLQFFYSSLFQEAAINILYTSSQNSGNFRSFIIVVVKNMTHGYEKNLAKFLTIEKVLVAFVVQWHNIQNLTMVWVIIVIVHFNGYCSLYNWWVSELSGTQWVRCCSNYTRCLKNYNQEIMGIAHSYDAMLKRYLV